MTELEEHIEQFNRDGFLVLPDILTKSEVTILFDGVEKAFANPSEEAGLYGETMQRIWRPKMFERGPEFEALVDHPKIIDLVEAILGSDCHLIANSALRTGPGDGISGWHADESIRFPRPKGVPLDPRIPIPCFLANFNYYLCDVDEELGPTQFIPGSHRSGRAPDGDDLDADGNPTYEGKSVFSAVGTAGTAVLWHDQTWHRGAPNLSKDRTRWVQQAPYGKRYIAQRFYPFINYHLPEEILDRANPRRKRLLGAHSIGAYG